MRNEVVFKVREYSWCKTEFAVFSADKDGLFTVTVRTGACSIHTYGTRDEVLALADMLRHAVDQTEEVQS